MRSPYLLGILLVACGTHRGLATSIDESADASAATPSKGAGHAGSSSVSTGQGALDLSPIKFEMDIDVPVGQELLKCIYAQMPTDRVTAIGSAESHYTPGSHHLLVYRSDLTAVPADNQGVWDCQDGSWII